MQALPLSSEVKFINANGVAALAKDVSYLTNFVDSLENGAMLRQNLDELQQTIALMQSDNHDEFFDISTRNKKYGRVDAMNGPLLLEKYLSLVHACPYRRLTELCRLVPVGQVPGRSAPLSNLSSRFGLA